MPLVKLWLESYDEDDEVDGDVFWDDPEAPVAVVVAVVRKRLLEAVKLLKELAVFSSRLVYESKYVLALLLPFGTPIVGVWW